MPIPQTLRVPHGTITLLLLLATPLCASTTPGPSTPILITMASDNAEAKQHIQLGVRDFLMGWEEQAGEHFHAAIEAERSSALAWCGLMLVEGATTESRDALAEIFSEDPVLTPQETALIESWLRLIQAGPVGAGEEFAERAEQYRNDTLSAAWAIRLLHDGYERIGGKALPNQQRALMLAEQLYTRKPQDTLAAYLRAWVEQSAPAPSDTALAAAQHAAETLPEHPATQLLCGHMLYRKGRLKEAIPHLKLAVKQAETSRNNVPHGTMEQRESRKISLEMWPLEVRIKLYLSTLFHLDGQKQASEALQRELLKNAGEVPESQRRTPGAVLLHWEARTLPLRLLMLSPSLPTDAQVHAAVQAATPAGVPAAEPLHELRDCLRFCLVARQRAAAGKGTQARKCLEAAEAAFKRYEASREDCARQGAYVLSAWTRMHAACELALLAAKAAAYPDSAEFWRQSFEEKLRPETLLMPPVLPQVKK